MDIIEIFYQHRNEEQAIPMAKYMRNQYPFLGLKRPERDALTREFFKEKKKEPEIDWAFIFKAYDLPEREFQLLAIDYLNKVKDKLKPVDMDHIKR